MIYQLFYYSYYFNYGLYFIITYYVFGTVNLSHDIYRKFKKEDTEICCLMANLDNDWIVIDN